MFCVGVGQVCKSLLVGTQILIAYIILPTLPLYYHTSTIPLTPPHYHHTTTTTTLPSHDHHTTTATSITTPIRQLYSINSQTIVTVPRLFPSLVFCAFVLLFPARNRTRNFLQRKLNEVIRYSDRAENIYCMK